MKLQYSIVIQWSDEDQAYLVTLPEFGPTPKTHGATYREAFKHAEEVMETLVDFYKHQGLELPEPKKYREPKRSRKPAKKVRVR